MNLSRPLVVLFAAASLAALAPAADAASSYDGCAGFINSLPATISTQGVWCLNQDLGTGVASGNAITITTNNVTIDCNGFKLGGLAAGSGTATTGIAAVGRSNITIRDCNIRGFATGVGLSEDGGGHRVEDNRFDGNTVYGMIVSGDGSIVRRNQVRDTGGTTGAPPSWIVGIAAAGFVDVLENQIVGTDGTGAGSGLGIAILVAGPSGNRIAGNSIGTVVPGVEGTIYGLAMLSGGQLDIRDNTFGSNVAGASVACSSGQQALYGNALLMGTTTGDCYDGGDNYGWPVAAP